eukprot:COSAG02_NODE_1358_length_13076_cov_6.377745_10_plen_76_part_00
MGAVSSFEFKAGPVYILTLCSCLMHVVLIEAIHCLGNSDLRDGQLGTCWLLTLTEQRVFHGYPFAGKKGQSSLKR